MDSAVDKVSKKRTGASKQEIGNILRDLVQMAQEIDPSGTTRDFSKRKSFVYYDPYNPERSTAFAHLEYEGEERNRASLIVEMHTH